MASFFCMDPMQLGCTRVDFKDRKQLLLAEQEASTTLKRPLDTSFSGKRHQGSNHSLFQSISYVYCRHLLYCIFTYDTYGGFLKWGYPQIIHFNDISIINQPSIWGYPHFGNLHTNIPRRSRRVWGDGRWLATTARDAQQIPMGYTVRFLDDPTDKGW